MAYFYANVHTFLNTAFNVCSVFECTFILFCELLPESAVCRCHTQMHTHILYMLAFCDVIISVQQSPKHNMLCREIQQYFEMLVINSSQWPFLSIIAAVVRVSQILTLAHLEEKAMHSICNENGLPMRQSSCFACRYQGW